MTVIGDDRCTMKPVAMQRQESYAQFDGISVTVAALFVLGAVAGAGIVAMPNAFLKAGWYIIPLVVFMCGIGCYTAMQLGWCWSILVENWPEYSRHTRNPYGEIAYRAGGNFLKYSAQTCVIMSMYGSAVSLLILASKNLSQLVHDFTDTEINICYMLCIVAACMLPIMLFGTPKDFWLIALAAILATIVAISLIVAGTFIDMDSCRNKVTYPDVKFSGIISAYCTICYAYGGHPAFPTVQHDMKKPWKFPVSALISFIVLFILYLPMPVLAYTVYGNTIQGTIEMNLSSKWIRDVIMILITSHVIFAFFILMNPVSQDLERVLRVPVEFSWKRVLTRTCLMGLTLFVTLSLPDFNTVLEIVGGTGLATGAYVFPGPCYMLLKRKTQRPNQQINLEDSSKKEKSLEEVNESRKVGILSHHSSNGHRIPIWELMLNCLIVLLGIGGAVITLHNVFNAEASFRKPCFLNGMHLDMSSAAQQDFSANQCWKIPEIFNQTGEIEGLSGPIL